MKYLLAVDGSQSALHAFMWVTEHAKRDDHVYLTHIYHEQANVRCVKTIDDSVLARKRGEALIKRLSKRLKKAKIPHTPIIRYGDARKRLPKTAKKLDIDIIVMGRRGKTQDQHLYVGSVSQYVVEHAPCSVVVVKEDKRLQPQVSAIADEVAKEEKKDKAADEVNEKNKEVETEVDITSTGTPVEPRSKEGGDSAAEAKPE